MPGRCHDSGAFSQSSIFTMFENGEVFPPDHKIVGGINAPYHILGDSAFKLTPWLLKPYSASIEEDKIHFNNIHSDTRKVIECTFGRCKARWRRILNCLHLDIENVSGVVTAAFVLNNICEEFKEEFNEIWLNEANIIENERRNVTNPPNHSLNDSTQNRTSNTSNAKRIRDAFKDYFWSTRSVNIE